MPLYTGIGDRGTTALFDGTTVAKTDIRVTAYGEVDELNTIIGVAHAMGLSDGLSEIIVTIQQDLFSLGSLLADPTSKISERVTKVTLDDSDVKRLEVWIDRLEKDLSPLKNFILPSGCQTGAAFHHARAVCRRAERSIVAIGAEHVQPELLRYINRLSDLLFVMARCANRDAGAVEREW